MSDHNQLKLKRFKERFQNEDACREYLFSQRWPKGFVCPRCGHTEYYDLLKRGQYQCKACKHQASITAGTVMHKTRTPLVKWFLAIYLTGHSVRGVSARRLMNDLGLTYPTAWLMLHKIRSAMSQSNASHLLAGIVESEGSFFEAFAGCGTQGSNADEAPVIARISLDSQKQPLYVRMSVVGSVYDGTITDTVPRSFIFSNVLCPYNAFADSQEHSLLTTEPETLPCHTELLRTMVSDAKAFIKRVYRVLNQKHLQAYLDEFCFRINQRRFKGQMFDRLLYACANSGTVTYNQLIADLA